MKKRFLSLLMAFCLMLSLAPAAFAAEGTPATITRPDGQVITIPNVADYENELGSQPMTINSAALQPDANGVYHITSTDDFKNVPASEWSQNKTFELECDLNLSQVSQPDEWGGYIRFFKGTFNGNGHKIYNFANNTYFIYAMIGGSINDLTIQLNGPAGALIFAPGSDGTPPVKTNLNYIKATGSVNLSSADQSNYSPFIYACGPGGLKMFHCTNQAEINGNIYGGIFYGYYPIYVNYNSQPVKYEFDYCCNKADVTMKYASMFFGNPTSIENKLTDGSLDVTITNCSNTGEIRGTVSSHYFAPSLEGTTLSGKVLEKENAIQAETTNTLPAEKLTIGEEPAGFTYSVNADRSISITSPSNLSNVSYYVVSVSSYCYMYSYDESLPTDKKYNGTDRYSVTERIDAQDLETYGVTLKYQGIADGTYGESGTSIICYNKEGNLETYLTRVADGVTYYTLPLLTDLVDGKYQRYAHMENDIPVPGTNVPYFLDVSAFDVDGNVLGFAKEASTT